MKFTEPDIAFLLGTCFGLVIALVLRLILIKNVEEE